MGWGRLTARCAGRRACCCASKDFAAQVWRERGLRPWLADVSEVSADTDFEPKLNDVIRPVRGSARARRGLQLRREDLGLSPRQRPVVAAETPALQPRTELAADPLGDVADARPCNQMRLDSGTLSGTEPLSLYWALLLVAVAADIWPS